MDYFKLRKIEEADFEGIVIESGGQRAVPDESIEQDLNADFLLNEAVIELKISEEEGLEKSERQQKLANLFSECQPGRPVVVLDPGLLDEQGQRKYYRILEGSIKTNVKKAAKQLVSTSEKISGDHVRVLVAINNGYSALSHDEFKQVVVKCARNDTSQIDYVVVGGMYHYSDKFDTYVICPFECTGINFEDEFASFDNLRSAWNTFVETEMTELITRTEELDRQKFPVLDLEFDIDDKRYVKPAPQWGNSSRFYANGRPRIDTTGLETCPPVGNVFPRISAEEWLNIRNVLSDAEVLKDSYEEWIQWKEQAVVGADSPLRPLVEMTVAGTEFEAWLNEFSLEPVWQALQEFATHQFTQKLRQIIDAAKQFAEDKILPSTFILLRSELIGMDVANDLATILDVSVTPGFERENAIIEDQKCSFQHGLAVASAYAIKFDRSCVFFEKDLTYAWH